ncbi:hypothetical protein [Desulfosporosinus sp. OT]|uniref:hypothetical protein n=1 Tax=Desulfosporosinus sp. OT TaxID=913865 RepID=UPI000223ABE7|nr:hypothetical protein [Desulfosporosinus sp. OT]EGW40332.1 hypothetical protein DOT_1672 [Desulfosporosinus sp. OT]
MNANITREQSKVRVELIPLKGIQIGTEDKVQFGQSKEAVKGILGNPNTEYDNKLYYDDLEIRIDFDVNGCVEFMEVLSGPYCEKIEPFMYGKNPFELVDTQLLQFLAEMNNGSIDDHEAVYGYSFLNISVGIWRDMTSKNIEEMIHEVKEAGNYDLWKEELEMDLERTKYFRDWNRR